MSLRELLAGGGGVKSIQTGWVEAIRSGTTGTANQQDTSYLDVTISAVDPNKCVVFHDLGFATPIATARLKASSTSVFAVSGRVFNSTTVRLSAVNDSASNLFAGRWTVVEYK